ncbi:hypothetical protein D3C73_1564570 [compost metagenome]
MDIGYLWLALGERTCFVKNNRLNITDTLQMNTTLEQHTFTGSVGYSGQNCRHD